MTSNPKRWLPLLGAGLAGMAHANCADLISALERADREPRMAQLDLEKRDQPIATAKPVLVRIGKVHYDGFGSDLERVDSDGSNPVLAQLRRGHKAGTARCESAGADTWRGAAVSKIRFDNPLAPKSVNPTLFWIARSSGLPVYHEIATLGPGGYAWVYGDAVKSPVTKK
jgi:hypothetical protein